MMQQPSFKALVQANRNAGRLECPKAPQATQKMQQAGMRLWPDEFSQAKELAESEERSAASFMRRVYLRGLELYLAEQGAASTTAATQ